MINYAALGFNTTEMNTSSWASLEFFLPYLHLYFTFTFTSLQHSHIKTSHNALRHRHHQEVVSTQAQG